MQYFMLLIDWQEEKKREKEREKRRNKERNCGGEKEWEETNGWKMEERWEEKSREKYGNRDSEDRKRKGETRKEMMMESEKKREEKER